LLGVKGTLGRDRSTHTVHGMVERGQHAVTPVLDYDPTMPFDLALEDGVVARQRNIHDVRVFLPPARRVLEIREQDRHGRKGLVRHGRYCGTAPDDRRAQSGVPCRDDGVCHIDEELDFPGCASSVIAGEAGRLDGVAGGRHH
jgi:hypothetical protein